jgi:hypothetical protein
MTDSAFSKAESGNTYIPTDKNEHANRSIENLHKSILVSYMIQTFSQQVHY